MPPLLIECGGRMPPLLKTMNHSFCQSNVQTRRQILRNGACGFGALALAGLCKEAAASAPNPLAARPPMFAPKAKRVIFIFMAGGPSHVDSYDYKPELIKRDGQDYDFVGVRFDTFGKPSKRKLLKPLWNFRQYGETGRHVSELFPHTAGHIDKLCMIHSMHTEGVAHGPSTLFLHTGATNLVRPSMGSWISYGLGTCLLYTSPSPRDATLSRMPSSA